MSYVLIDLDTGNTVGFFPTERAALEDVVDSIERYGEDSVESLGLAFNDPAGPVRRVAAGRELAHLAFGAGKQPTARTNGTDSVAATGARKTTTAPG
jgi:hypothetical protein